MAISKNGILGGFSGKIGNVVGVRLNGEQILRTLPRPSKKTPTEKQNLQRLKFAFAIEFTKPFLWITERFFMDDLSGGVRKNKIISYTLSHVITIKDQEFNIEWSKFLLSSGALSGFHCLETHIEDQVISLQWQDNSHQGFANAEDDVYAVIVSESLEKIAFLEKISTRSTLHATLNLPTWLATETVHVYLFLHNLKAKQSSNSFYVGKYKAGVSVG